MADDFPNLPGFPIDSLKKLKPEVEKLRNVIQHGALEYRRRLFDKLGQLVLAYILDCQFDRSLQTIEELIELGETLIEEGQIELRNELFIYISQAISLLKPVSQQNNLTFNQTLFFKHYSKSVEYLSEEEFNEIKNEWAFNIHQYAESLYEDNNATIAAIALLDSTIQTIEQQFNPNSSHFADWRPLLDMYRSRGLWKFEIGDRESGLADLLYYEKLAEKAHSKRQHQRNEISRRTIHQDNKIIIRIGDNDLVDHLASFNFEDQYHETMLRLGDMFASRAEKEKALEYYDKALAIAQRHDRTDSHFPLFAANGEIPLRKGHLILQFREYENALQLFDFAGQKFKMLLNTDQKQHFEILEKRLAEVERCRAEALENLGRYDEAILAIDEMQRIFNKSTETAKISKIARAEKADKIPFAEEFKKLQKKNKTSNQSPLQHKKQPITEEDIEQTVLKHLYEKHNDAVADYRRGHIELRRGHLKTALKFFLRSRFIFNAPVFEDFPETQNNLCGVYAGIAQAYLSLERYDNAEKWFNRAISHTQKLINEGKLDLQPAFFETMEGLAYLFSKQKKYEEAIGLYEKVYNERNRVVAENLEGLNIEYLRTHDHQRLALSALLLQLQSKTIRYIEEKFCLLDRIDEAILWGQRELEIFEQFLCLLPDPFQAYYDYSLAIVSYAALLLLGGRYEEADALLETCNRKLADYKQRNSDSKDKKEDEDRDKESGEKERKNRQKRIDRQVISRLFDVFGTGKYRFEKELLSQILYLFQKKRFSEMLPILESLKEPVKQRQIEAQNDHRLLQLFWKEFERMIDDYIEQNQKDISEQIDTVRQSSSFDLSNSDAVKISEEEKSESEELDQELAQYEKDYGGENISNDLLYQLLNEMTGSTLTSNMMRKYDKGKFEKDKFETAETGQPFRNTNVVKRNDPCPCGSGKKYKKCCMKQQE
jgi:tetratricopeptide (TPR) repeat protein